MRVDDLRLLLAIVEHGGYRAAAEATGVPQPFITRRIHALERDLGKVLLLRGPGGSTLTLEGRLVAARARTLVGLADEMVRPLGDRERTRIRLGAAATAAGSFLATFLATWIPAHPDVELTMLEDGALNLRERLSRQECDLAVVALPIPPTMEHRLVTRVTVQALFPPDHRLARSRAPVAIGDLDRERVLLNGAPFISTNLVRAAATMAGCELDVVYECSVGQTLAALAEGGLGIAVVGDSVDLRGFDLPRRFVTDQHGRPLTFELHVAWLRARPLTGVALDFAIALASHAALPDIAARGGTAGA
jgi:DNA-binding transcriptional LysR family regulator